MWGSYSTCWSVGAWRGWSGFSSGDQWKVFARSWCYLLFFTDSICQLDLPQERVRLSPQMSSNLFWSHSVSRCLFVRTAPMYHTAKVQYLTILVLAWNPSTNDSWHWYLFSYVLNIVDLAKYVITSSTWMFTNMIRPVQWIESKPTIGYLLLVNTRQIFIDSLFMHTPIKVFVLRRWIFVDVSS